MGSSEAVHEKLTPSLMTHGGGAKCQVVPLSASNHIGHGDDSETHYTTIKRTAQDPPRPPPPHHQQGKHPVEIGFLKSKLEFKINVFFSKFKVIFFPLCFFKFKIDILNS